MIPLIDIALKDKLEHMYGPVSLAVYADSETAFRRYVETQGEDVRVPFCYFIGQALDFSPERYNGPLGRRGLRHSYSDTRETVNTKKLIPVTLQYTIGAFLGKRSHVIDWERLFYFWLVNEAELTIEIPNSVPIHIHVDYNVSSDASNSPGLTTERYTKGEYYQTESQILVKGFYTQDCDVKTILEINMQLLDDMYNGDGVLLASWQFVPAVEVVETVIESETTVIDV